MKFSKDLLELRDKEAKLVRMKRYEEAEKVKMKADLLEEFERNKLEAEVSQNLGIRAVVCRQEFGPSQSTSQTLEIVSKTFVSFVILKLPNLSLAHIYRQNLNLAVLNLNLGR